MAALILFDGHCVLCGGTVRFVLAREAAPDFVFAATVSPAGRAIAARHGLDPAVLEDSFAVIEDGRVLLRSEAAFRVARSLRAPWRFLGVLSVLPRFLSDAVYGFVARNRLRWFGRRDACFLPSASERHRFLEEAPGSW